MSKTRQVAKVSIGAYVFSVAEQSRADGEKAYKLYRAWSEYLPFGRVQHKTLDGSFEFYHDVLKTLAEYQYRYYHYCRVPTIHEISV